MPQRPRYALDLLVHVRQQQHQLEHLPVPAGQRPEPEHMYLVLSKQSTAVAPTRKPSRPSLQRMLQITEHAESNRLPSIPHLQCFRQSSKTGDHFRQTTNSRRRTKARLLLLRSFCWRRHRPGARSGRPSLRSTHRVVVTVCRCQAGRASSQSTTPAADCYWGYYVHTRRCRAHVSHEDLPCVQVTGCTGHRL